MTMFVKGQPTPGDVHVNGPLTNISIAYFQEATNFVADKVFPNIPVPNQSDVYYIYDRGMFNRNQMGVRSTGAETKGVDYTVDNTSTYHCQTYGLHHDIPDQVRSNADVPLQPDREATELLMHQAMIHREALWATNFFATSKWTTDLDVSGTTYWDAASGSDPLGQIETGKQTVGASTGYEPNEFIMGRAVWGALRNHADVVDRIKYGQTAGSPAVATLEAFAALIEVENVRVSRAIYNSANEGVTNVHSYILGDGALLCYSAPNPGIMTPSGGYTFSWSGYLGAGAAGQRIRRFRMEHLAADRVEIEMAYVPELVSADMGYFFTDCLT